MTDRETAERRIATYIRCWIDADPSDLDDLLTADVDIVESDGRRYIGRDEVRRWFADWHGAGGQGTVTDWRVTRFAWDAVTATATIEWDFACIYRGRTGNFPGASVITFAAGRIAAIREYKTAADRRRPYRATTS